MLISPQPESYARGIIAYLMKSELTAEIKQAAAILIEAGAQEVYLFGSAAEESQVEGSDVDMAISGLPPHRFYQALSAASRVMNRSLDLVDLDEHTPFTQFLKQQGKSRRVA